MSPDFWNWFWQRRWICDISVRIYETFSSAAVPSHLWFRLLIWHFFKNINPALRSVAFSAQSFFFFFSSSAHQLKAWNVKCKCSWEAIWTLTAVSVFLLLLFRQSAAFCAPPNPAHSYLFLPEDAALHVSLTSITFCWLPCVTRGTKTLTIRCLNFEQLLASLPQCWRKDQVLNI